MIRQCVLGVDVSTRSIALACPAKRVVVINKMKTRDISEIIRHQGIWFDRMLKAIKPTNLAIESPIMGMSKNALTAIKLSMITGMIVSRCDLPVKYFPPATWKKQVCGKGNYGKEEVSTWLKANRMDLWPLCTSQDEIDACCIALAGEIGHDGQPA